MIGALHKDLSDGVHFELGRSLSPGGASAAKIYCAVLHRAIGCYMIRTISN